MRAITDHQVPVVTARIADHFRPRRIIAFGSYARGEHGPDGDLDLIVQIETDKPFWEPSLDVPLCS